MKIYKYSEERRHKISESHKGKKLSDETKRKIGDASRKRITPEIAKKMSNARKNFKCSNETRKKQSLARLGKEPWNKGKIGVQVAWNKGISHDVEFKCLKCNFVFIKNISSTKQYCSKECANTSIIRNQKIAVKNKHRTGKLANHWKGGITPEIQKARNSEDAKIWKLRVLERDNYTCVLCDSKSEQLHTDHIKSFAKYPELRFDINNGRTLCRPCHYKVTFGKIMPENSKWGLPFRNNNKVKLI